MKENCIKSPGRIALRLADASWFVCFLGDTRAGIKILRDARKFNFPTTEKASRLSVSSTQTRRLFRLGYPMRNFLQTHPVSSTIAFLRFLNLFFGFRTLEHGVPTSVVLSIYILLIVLSHSPYNSHGFIFLIAYRLLNCECKLYEFNGWITY